MKILVRPAAAADIEEAYSWYELQEPGLGNEFLSAVDQAINAVAEYPDSYPVVHRNTRRAHVKRFPYGLFYRHDEVALVVVACFHGRRKPSHWRGPSDG